MKVRSVGGDGWTPLKGLSQQQLRGFQSAIHKPQSRRAMSQRPFTRQMGRRWVEASPIRIPSGSQLSVAARHMYEGSSCFSLTWHAGPAPHSHRRYRSQRLLCSKKLSLRVGSVSWITSHKPTPELAHVGLHKGAFVVCDYPSAKPELHGECRAVALRGRPGAR